jgi:hypothetical protein
MEILEQRPQFLVCHQSATQARGMGVLFFAIGAGTMAFMSRAHAPILALVIGAVFAIVGGVLFAMAEDDRIVVDKAAKVARIIRRGLMRQSTTEVPLASIKDVALEVSRSNATYGSNNSRVLTYRPVFVTTDGRRVPWTPISTNDRASQALPVEGSPVVARAMGVVQNVGCLYAFCALFCSIILMMVGSQVYQLMTFRPTPATVVSTDIATVHSSKGGNTYKPIITYTYTVAGTQYTSSRLAPITESSSERWAESVQRRYEPGGAITAWYNPKRPSDAYIEHTLQLLPIAMIGVMVFVVGIIIYNARRFRRMGVAAIAGGDVPVLAA